MGPFDSRSIVAVTALFSVVCVVFALQLRHEQPASARSMRAWAPGVALTFVAMVLMGRRGVWSEFLTSFVANLVLWGGLSLCTAGLYLFAERKPPVRWLVASGVVIAVLTYVYVWPYPNYSFRLAVNATFIGLFAAFAFCAGTEIKPRSPPVWILILCYAFLAVLCALRFILVVSGLDPTTSLLDQNWIQTTFLAGYGMLNLLGNGAFLTIVNASEREALRRSAAYDPLSGALNRGAVTAMLEREFKRAERRRSPLAVMLIDIDHFKQVNDNFGHAAGDRAIADFARLAMSQLRACDAFGRYGGEEFLAVLPETGVPAAANAAERLRSHVSAALGDGPAYTISTGVATLMPGMTWDMLIKAADIALYRAKAKGRNRVEIYSLDAADSDVRNSRSNALR